MKKVEYIPQNLTACRCAQCSVQMFSSCVKEEVRVIKEKIDPLEQMPSPDKTPQIYCSHGQANCPGLDFSQKCACPTCAVWAKNVLASFYFCYKGSADKNG